MANNKVTLSLVFYLVSGVITCAQNPIGLRASASPRGLTFGTEAPIPYLRCNVDNGQYLSNLSRNYQLIIPASAFMPTHIWMGENQYNFTDTDWLLGATPNSTGWAQQNGFQVRAHALIWASDPRIPTWLLEQESSITPDKAKSLLSDYIHTLVSRYRGKIPEWHAINEAISDYNETRPFNLRDSFWYRKLGENFTKYAFIFAHEADPSIKLFYNEYKIEHTGLKADRTFEFISWLKSEGVPIYGVGMQWHINTSEVITPGDEHYQIAQRFLDLNISLTVTELDVAVQMKDGFPADPDALQKQATIYRSMMQYVLHFFPKISDFTTWGFTDRYSWIPGFTNYSNGVAVPLDCQYQPKPAYWQLQDVLFHVLVDGVYRLSPQSQPDKCLGTSDNDTTSSVHLNSGNCNNTNEKWNVAWLGDGTYRFSPQSANNSALNAYNASAPVGGVAVYNWTGDFNQEWMITPKDNNTYRLSPRNAWWRILAVDRTSNIVIADYTVHDPQQWILTTV